MSISRAAMLALLVLTLSLAGCEANPSDTTPNPPVASNATPAVPATLGANETPFPNTNQTLPPLPTAAAAYCPGAGAVTPAPSEPLAATVNGQPIPLGLYQREAAQAEAALAAQGVDLKSQNGQQELKGLQQQVLGQLIDDVLVEQAAQKQNITVSAQDVNNRIQQLVDDAGGSDKFNEYLKTKQIQLDDLCIQMRSSIYGEIMLTRVTATLPTKVEQVHAARILLATQAEAEQVLEQLKAGKDFATLAKQFSKDEATRDNGGDLGWLPRGIMPPEFDAAAFALQPGQVSGVVTTPEGWEIIKVIERDPAHDLSADMLQYQRQQAFLAWLTTQRQQGKIQKLVNP